MLASQLIYLVRPHVLPQLVVPKRSPGGAPAGSDYAPERRMKFSQFNPRKPLISSSGNPLETKLRVNSGQSVQLTNSPNAPPISSSATFTVLWAGSVSKYSP
jgi:hypothetical protein